MATGRLGVADLAAATNTTLYTVPSSTFSVVTVSVVNRGTGPANIRIAIASSATPADSEYVEYDVEIVQDTTKQDGAPIKILGSKQFKQFFPDFQFTDYETGIQSTINYYKGLL